MTNLTFERARRDKRVSDLLARMCDFDLSRIPDAKDWFRIESLESFEPIAGDGSGGAYLLGAGGRIVYVTSEGQAGVIAMSLAEALSLFVACPYWQDVLKFSARGDLAEMRRAALFFEKGFAENESFIEKERNFLCAELSLEKPADPVAALHEAVALGGVDIRINAADGTPFDSLFNRFTVKANRAGTSA